MNGSGGLIANPGPSCIEEQLVVYTDLELLMTDLEIAKAKIKLAEQRIYETESPEFIRGHENCKEMIVEYLAVHKDLLGQANAS